MNTRTITGTIVRPSGAMWPNAALTFRLLRRFAVAADIALPDRTTATTASDGTFSVALAVPDSGTAAYEFTAPAGGSVVFYLAAGAPIELAVLLASYGTNTPPDAVAVEAGLRAAADAALQAQIDAGGSGAVASVNGQTGVVVLDAADVGADASGTAAGLVASEAATRASADTTLQTNITTEASARAAADSARYTRTETDTLLLSYLLSSNFTWANLSGKPSSFTPATHASTHAAAGSDALTLSQGQVTNLTSDLAAKASASALSTHLADTANPHAVTAAQVGAYTSGAVDTLLAAKQPLDSDLTAIAALTTTTYGRALLTAADAAGAQILLALGSLATQSSVTASQVSDASRKGRAVGTVYDTAAREWIRGEASGSAAMIGFLGANAAVQQTGGAATASGTYGVTEQGMIQKAYDALRTFGLLS